MLKIFIIWPFVAIVCQTLSYCVLGPVPSPPCVFTLLTLPAAIVDGEMRLREVKKQTQGHTAHVALSWDSSPGPLMFLWIFLSLLIYLIILMLNECMLIVKLGR